MVHTHTHTHTHTGSWGWTHIWRIVYRVTLSVHRESSWAEQQPVCPACGTEWVTICQLCGLVTWCALCPSSVQSHLKSASISHEFAVNLNSLCRDLHHVLPLTKVPSPPPPPPPPHTHTHTHNTNTHTHTHRADVIWGCPDHHHEERRGRQTGGSDQFCGHSFHSGWGLVVGLS